MQKSIFADAMWHANLEQVDERLSILYKAVDRKKFPDRKKKEKNLYDVKEMEMGNQVENIWRNKKGKSYFVLL